MTDRELLEKAAKAAGIEVRRYAIKPASGEGDGLIGYMTDAAVWPRGWFDPLTDDGDALRLAVKVGVTDLAIAVGQLVIMEGEQADIYATVRRAIVRAAAQIGESQ